MEGKLFGSSGIRGDAVKLFTNQFSFDLGQTFSLFLKRKGLNGPIALGIDSRFSSPRIAGALASGIIYQSYGVDFEGVTPIPSICYLLQVDTSLAGSLMVTGSHIQEYLNGVKFFFNREEILKSHEEEIESIYQSIKNRVEYRDLSSSWHLDNRANEEYQEYLQKSAKTKRKKFTIIVDPGNGAQSDTMPMVLKKLGHKVIEISASIQDKILTRDTEAGNDFVNLQKTVIKSKADFGVGYDSDGDRTIFIDHEGQFIPGDYTGSLIARESVSEYVITPINTSQVAERIGKKVIRTKVGSPYVVAAMKEHDCDFGFEANGGGIFKNMRTRDGGRTTIEIINLLSKYHLSLKDLVNQLPKYYLARDKIPYRWELNQTILDQARSHFKGVRVEELDGLKIWLDDSTWILFRSSANAPEFRVFVESSNQLRSEKLLKEGLELVKTVAGEAK